MDISQHTWKQNHSIHAKLSPRLQWQLSCNLRCFGSLTKGILFRILPEILHVASSLITLISLITILSHFIHIDQLTCLINQTGVLSIFSPLKARTSKSASPCAFVITDERTDDFSGKHFNPKHNIKEDNRIDATSSMIDGCKVVRCLIANMWEGKFEVNG